MPKNTALDTHIVSIVQKHKIQEQSDLQQLLKERGYTVPQATLSRRIKSLNIVKVAGLYQALGLQQMNLPIVLNIQFSDFGQIVLHTPPGQASSLAAYIDQKYVTFSVHNANKSGVLGTIAGDDTVLLLVKTKADVLNVVNLLKMDFPYLLT